MKTVTQKTHSEIGIKIAVLIAGIAIAAFAVFVIFVHPGNIS